MCITFGELWIKQKHAFFIFGRALDPPQALPLPCARHLKPSPGAQGRPQAHPRASQGAQGRPQALPGPSQDAPQAPPWSDFMKFTSKKTPSDPPDALPGVLGCPPALQISSQKMFSIDCSKNCYASACLFAGIAFECKCSSTCIFYPHQIHRSRCKFQDSGAVGCAPPRGHSIKL